jgi:hypothetical protein
MMYLRMVTSQAEKLKRFADREVRITMFPRTYMQMSSSSLGKTTHHTKATKSYILELV